MNSTKNLSGIKLPLSAAGHQPKHYVGFVPAQLLEGVVETKGVEKVADAQVDVTATMERGQLKVKGYVEAGVSLTCSRCLKVYDLTLSGQVSRSYSEGGDPLNQSMGELEVVEELVYLEEEPFTVPPMVDEELQLKLPMLPLCSEACKGLCPRCGVDLNKQGCSCETGHEESPFAALKQLKI
uniref:DUF177 domain-containing protein n=1 Tax=Magnetococcus massalia (strain MO-1) TaxID=451514 RepID=A0A1S7LFL8_MAGMO|nr:Conserved protein of unknown function [Candidatus Magnetococcus massalia]